jgi:hypothetical protein
MARRGSDGWAEVVSLDSRRPKRPEGPARDPSALRRTLGVMAVFLAMGLAALGLSALPTAESPREAVARMPEARRADFVERTRDDLEHACQRGDTVPDPVRTHCVEQARFLLLFPECKQDCQQLVSRFLPQRALSR